MVQQITLPQTDCGELFGLPLHRLFGSSLHLVYGSLLHLVFWLQLHLVFGSPLHLVFGLPLHLVFEWWYPACLSCQCTVCLGCSCTSCLGHSCISCLGCPCTTCLGPRCTLCLTPYHQTIQFLHALHLHAIQAAPSRRTVLSWWWQQWKRCTGHHYQRFCFIKDGHLPRNKERKHEQFKLHGVGRSARPTSRWAWEAHRMMGKTQKRHCEWSFSTNITNGACIRPGHTTRQLFLPIWTS